MTGLLQVARREIAQRQMALAAAAAAGALVVASPSLPGVGREDLPWGCLVMALLFTVGLGLGVGSSAIGGELASRRLAFYFSRPLSPLAIWGGKVLGALGLLFACQVIVMLPAAAVSARARDVMAAWPFGTGAVVTLAILALGVALGILVHARSRFLLVDVLALPIAALFLTAVGMRFYAAWFYEALPVEPTWELAVAVFALLLLAAAGRAVAIGRGDAVRFHKAFSSTFWPSLFAAGALAYPVPAMLIHAELVHCSPVIWWSDGRKIGPHAMGSLLTPGRSKGMPRSVIVDVAKGRAIPIEHDLKWMALEGPFFSGDGRRAAWVEQEVLFHFGKGPWRHRLAWIDFREPSAVVHRFPIDADGDQGALSPDGRRMVVVSQGKVELFDLETGRLVAPSLLPRHGIDDGCVLHVCFPDEERFRVYRSVSSGRNGAIQSAVEIWEVDGTTGQSERTGRIDAQHAADNPWGPDSRVGPGCRLFLDRPSDGGSLALYDGRDGALVSALPVSRNDIVAIQTGFLGDGRIVMLESIGGASRVRVFGADGAEESAIPVPESLLRLGGEPTPGSIVVTGSVSFEYRDYLRTGGVWLVDTRAGSARKVASGLRPVPVSGNDISAVSIPQGDAARLFMEGTVPTRLVYFDPQSGTRRVLFGGS